MMAGLVVGVVGPSGVGKDSVMSALAMMRPGVHIVRRAITRSPDDASEVFDAVDEAEFTRSCEVGEFVLHWSAHGLRYGIPVSQIGPASLGQVCLVNLSRSVLLEAQQRFARFVTLHLTAPAAVLAERLQARGREDADQIAKRLSRAAFTLPEGLEPVVEIENDGPLDVTARRALDALETLQSERA